MASASERPFNADSSIADQLIRECSNQLQNHINKVKPLDDRYAQFVRAKQVLEKEKNRIDSQRDSEYSRIRRAYAAVDSGEYLLKAQKRYNTDQIREQISTIDVELQKVVNELRRLQ